MLPAQIITTIIPILFSIPRPRIYSLTQIFHIFISTIFIITDHHSRHTRHFLHNYLYNYKLTLHYCSYCLVLYFILVSELITPLSTDNIHLPLSQNPFNTLTLITLHTRLFTTPITPLTCLLTVSMDINLYYYYYHFVSPYHL